MVWKLHYRKSAAIRMPYHGALVEVVARSRGPGPRNVLVRDIVTGKLIVVPWRNVRRKNCND